MDDYRGAWIGDDPKGYPNGCKSNTTFEKYLVCERNGWITNYCYCNHPDRDSTINKWTNKSCTPCNANASIPGNQSWSFNK